MIYLLESIWYAFALLFEICWLPFLIIAAVAIIFRIIGKAARSSKKDDSKSNK